MTIEDREAIRELIAKYCHFVDAADTEGWLSLYTEDGSLDLGFGQGPISGEALRTFAAARRPNTGLHLSANPIIEIDGGEATVASYVVVLGNNDEPQVGLAGRYEDRVRRVDGEWKFASRRLTPQMRRRA